jgi:glycosyltransferase involved in cell wall biosynthesis
MNNQTTLPLVSLLIANFNNGKYIVETLQSAINQTYPNIEIIVVDDASTDNSVERIEHFIEKNTNAVIRFFQNRQNSGGCGGIKNQCIAVSKGKYFAFLDPEDTIEVTAIEQLATVHQQNYDKYSIVYSSHYLCNEKLEPQGISTWVGQIPNGESHLTSTDGHISAFALCSRNMYNKTSGINSNYQVAEDMDLYLKMEEIAPVFYINKPLYYYRKHTNNASWNYDKRYNNLLWRHTAETAAYQRRKNKNTNAKNLTIKQLHYKNFAFYMQMAKSFRMQKKYCKSAIYRLKAILYIYSIF